MSGDAFSSPDSDEQLNISQWLARLGLSQYSDAFVNNDIDLEVLPELTGEDLKEIGVTSVGHRRRVLSAIAAWVSQGAQDTPSLPPEAVPDAQRRMLTVMFCDLVGSTALSARTDPEEFSDFINQYRDAVQLAIAPYDAHVAQFAGDGLLAYFGYPLSSDHDAEKSIAASLAIVEAVAKLPNFSGEQPEVRIGLATGLTVVGGVDRSREMMGDSAVGETLNLAARLQSLAEAGQIVIADATRRLVGDVFDCENIGTHELKGFSQPIQAFQVSGRSVAESRFDALRSVFDQTDFAGRKKEISILRNGLANAGQSKQIFVVTGEGGIGKSRLVREAIFNSQELSQSGVLLQCSPYQKATPFYSLRYLIERSAELTGTDDPQQSISKVKQLFSRFGTADDERLAVAANLLSLEGVIETPSPAPTAAQWRQKTMTHMSDSLQEALLARPILFIEDIQWIDPSTAELLDILLTELADKPVMVVLTARSTTLPEWVRSHFHTHLPLSRLDDGAIRGMVGSMLEGMLVSAPIVDAIVERCAGVPVFAEELARSYASWGDDANSSKFLENVPATLAETMLARIDRLKKGRSIASIAAAIGREFPTDVLASVCDLPKDTFREGIDELLQAGILEPGYSPLGEAIRFRQMLVRDAAYQLLLRRDRQKLHGRIVETLRDEFPALAEAMPHVLALQMALAGNPDGSAEEWLRAGTLANQRSAFGEAVQHFRSGLESVKQCEDSEISARCEMALRTGLVGGLIASEGYSSAVVAEEMEAAVEAGQRAGSAESIVASLFAKWALMGPDVVTMRKLANRMLVAAEQGTETDRLIAHRSYATSLLFSAKIPDAIEAYMGFMEIYDESKHGEGLRKMHGDHALMVMMGLAEAHTLADNIEEGRAWGERVIRAAKKSERTHDIAHVLAFAGCLHPMLIGDVETTKSNARDLVEVCEANGISYWLGHGHLFEGLCTIATGERDKGFEQARKGMDLLLEANAFSNCWHVLKAAACIENDEIDYAENLLSLTERAIESGDMRFAPEFHRIRARLYTAQGRDVQDARTELMRSIALANEQGTLVFQSAAQADLDAL